MKRRMLCGATTAMVATALAMPSGAAAATADANCGPTLHECVQGIHDHAFGVVSRYGCTVIGWACDL